MKSIALRTMIGVGVGAVAALAVAALAVASPAAAAKPVKAPLPPPPPGVQLICPQGTVDVTFPIDKETSKTFYDSAGNITRILVEGRLIVSLYAEWSRQTVVMNESGPGETIFQNGVPVETIMTGQSNVFGPNGLVLDTSGRFVTNLITGQVTGHGTQMNICNVFE